MASTYSFSDSAAFATASAEKVAAGYVYSRWANRTVDLFESAVADLEGTEGAEAYSSGMAAISGLFLALCEAGDRVVAARQLYGNSYSLLAQRLPRYGIETTFVDLNDADGWAEAAPGATLLYCETIANPRIQVADLAMISEVGRAHSVPLVVDNTFASPILCRPVEHGADVVVHSATKFIGGHHDLIGGVVCAGGAQLDRARTLARDLGPTMSPFSAWLALRGLATLPLRIERSSDSALQVARFLDDHPSIENVYHPGLADSPDRELALQYLGGRGGGTLAFDVKGGRHRAARFQEALQLIGPAASLGGTHSLLVHAASVTHTQLDESELEAAGISAGFCRLSIGLEAADDLIDDLARSLEASEL